MTSYNDYSTIWMVYLAATVAALIVVWRINQIFPNREFRQIVLLFFIAVLWTPARLEPDSPHWVPAFMAALMESIALGTDAAISRVLPIGLVLIALLSLSFLWHLLKHKTRRRH